MSEKPENNFDNLDAPIVEGIVESEIEGGVKLEDLAVGKTLEILTQSRTYVLEKREDGYYISGHPEFCPEPTKATIMGSTFGGSTIKAGYVGRGMRLEFRVEGSNLPITTSAIKDIVEK